MKKQQIIEGLTAELYGLISTISVYRDKPLKAYDEAYRKVDALKASMEDKPESEIRHRFHQLKTALKADNMIGIRSLRCYTNTDNNDELTEFHTGSRVVLTRPVPIPEDECGYIRVKGCVTEVLPDGTFVMMPEAERDMGDDAS